MEAIQKIDDYSEFLGTKRLIVPAVGKRIEARAVNDVLFPFQRDLTRWSVRKGRSALFCGTGLGKTLMQLEWARCIGGMGIILAPLTVARQTVKEARTRLDLDVHYTRSGDDLVNGINITNYEMLDKFDFSKFDWVVLDESSILKAMQGATKQALIDRCADVPYRLCATATPAPNDLKEIANHAEFLGIMTRQEMLSVFFRYSQAGSMAREDAWQLKGHAVKDFYRWLASWGMAVRKPSDIGYLDDGYDLPPLRTELLLVDSDYTPEGVLPGFLVGGVSAIQAKKIRRGTIEDRCQVAVDKVLAHNDQHILWCGLNEEGDVLESLIPGSVQVTGSQSPDQKAELIEGFQDGKYRVLITKVSIAGFGMNLQNAHKMCFVGMDYSWEGYYQAVRRCFRFGQEHPVEVSIILSKQEEDVYEAVMRKEVEANEMIDKLVENSAQYASEELQEANVGEFVYKTAEHTADGWTIKLGDSVERLRELADDSVDISVYSPPFADLFVYSNTPRDVGNSRDFYEFFQHYDFIIRENLRVTKPGRLCFVHVTDLRAYLGMDGYIGVKDFSAEVVRAYERAGWIFWQRTTINKNPQTQAVRLKDHRLLFITLQKDSTGLSGGMPDYLLMFKKPGTNAVPVIPDVTEEEWIEWAHPVWNNIRETAVLPTKQAKAGDDEKHMCPLQLPVIERCIRLWSNKGELVLSPFAGIGSEGYEAVRLGRRFIGIELKPEYYNVAIQNLKEAQHKAAQPTLFSLFDQEPVQTDSAELALDMNPDTEEL